MSIETKPIPNTTATTSLDELDAGSHGTIVGIGCPGPVRCRLMDMGLTPGTEVRIEGVAPLGDPIIVCARGCRLGLRRTEASGITVSPCPKLISTEPCPARHRHGRHRVQPRKGPRRWPRARNDT